MQVVKIISGPSKKPLGIPLDNLLRKVYIDDIPSVSYTYFDSLSSKWTNISSFVNNAIFTSIDIDYSFDGILLDISMLIMQFFVTPFASSFVSFEFKFLSY